MARAIPAVCSVIGLVAVAAGGWATASPATEPGAIMPAALARLQRLATDSCRCERRAGESGRAACWADFDRQMPGNDEIGACQPSVQRRCGGPGRFGGNDCVTMSYSFEGYLLCTRDEVSAVQAVFYKELDATGGKGPTPETDQLFRDIKAGKPLPTLDAPVGCGGGAPANLAG